MLALSPTLQALAQAGPVELLPQGAGPEVGPGWVEAPAGAGTHVHICLQVSSSEGGEAHGIVGCWRTQGWTGRNALWDAGGPRGGRIPMHCGMLESPGWEDCNALWDAGGPRVGGPHCIVGWWRTQGWEDCNALWDAGGPRVGGPHCIVGWWRTWGGRTTMHCGMVEDSSASWDVGGARWGSGAITGF